MQVGPGGLTHEPGERHRSARALDAVAKESSRYFSGSVHEFRLLAESLREIVGEVIPSQAANGRAARRESLHPEAVD